MGNFKSSSSLSSLVSSDDESFVGGEGKLQWKRQVGPVWKLMKRWELKEATVLLELALWKCSLNDSCVESDSRAAARVGCGAEVTIHEVVEYISHDDFETDIFFDELFTLEEHKYESEDEWDVLDNPEYDDLT